MIQVYKYNTTTHKQACVLEGGRDLSSLSWSFSLHPSKPQRGFTSLLVLCLHAFPTTVDLHPQTVTQEKTFLPLHTLS